MSVANRYKSLTFSGAECFALLRAMATRENHLKTQLLTVEANQESALVAGYLTGQLEDLSNVLAKFSTTPFQEGRPS
jgi:hypothetical protein